jgi:hypothetical protein
MLRLTFVLVLGLAGASALGFTAWRATRERICCPVPREALSAPRSVDPLPPARLEVEAQALLPERAGIDASVPIHASDAGSGNCALPAVVVRARPAPATQAGYTRQLAAKRVQQLQLQQKALGLQGSAAKLAQERAKAELKLSSLDPAVLSKKKLAGATAAVVPPQPNPKLAPVK